MQIEKTDFNELLVLTPAVFTDSRGYFYEAHTAASFAEHGLDYSFIQDNQSFSTKGVIRGLHLQLSPYPQVKLIRVLHGEILDVVVDVRQGSATFGEKFSIRLSAINHKQLLIPAGFLHGFSVLSETATVLYKVDQPYDRSSERGVHYKDPLFDIDWEVAIVDVIVSEKDLLLPAFDQVDWEFKL